MSKTFLALGAVLALTSPSQAAMMSTDPAPVARVEKAQLLLPDPLGLFGFGGRQYCWYDDGWRGEGWYWCGYGNRAGYGWGGGEGFHGWRQHRYERDLGREDGGGGYRENDDNDGPPPLGGGYRERREFREGDRNHGGGGFREGGQNRGGGERREGGQRPGGGERHEGGQRQGGGERHEGGQHQGGGGGGFRPGGQNQGGLNPGPAPGAPAASNRGAGSVTHKD